MELIYKPIILTWVFTFGRYCILRGRLGNQNRPMKIMTSSMFAFEGPSVGHFSAGEFVYSDGNVVTGSRRQIPISRAFCGSSARAHFTRHLPPISMGGCSPTEVGRDKRHKTAIILHVKCMIRWRNSFSLARRALKGSNQYAPCAVHTVHYGPGQQASYSALRMYNDPWGGKGLSLTAGHQGNKGHTTAGPSFRWDKRSILSTHPDLVRGVLGTLLREKLKR